MLSEKQEKILKKMMKEFNGKTVTIKMRECQDVPKFLRKLRRLERQCVNLPEMKFK